MGAGAGPLECCAHRPVAAKMLVVISYGCRVAPSAMEMEIFHGLVRTGDSRGEWRR